MTNTTTGNIQAGGDITANDIITGLKIDNLTVVWDGLAGLQTILNQGESKFRLAEDGSLEALAGDEPLLSLPGKLLDAFRLLPRAADLSPAERQRAYAGWLVTRRPRRPAQRLHAREHYVDLAGQVTWDWEEDPLETGFSWLKTVGQGAERRVERERLPDVTQAVGRFPAFVLLGSPGSGKSTVLERLVYTTARDFLTGRSRRLPLLVTLAGYRWERAGPLAFIREQWAALVTGDFIELARAGQVLLLVDGLNEMPRLAQADDRRQRAAAWQRFFDDQFAEETPASSRAVIASRDADDYEQRLGLPRVEIEPLAPTQIDRFARAYLPQEAGPFLAAIERLELDEQAGNPFALFTLTQLFDPDHGDLPPNRGRLFVAYAAKLLTVMYKQDNAGLNAAQLALAQLGYRMQAESESTVLSLAQLLAWLPTEVRLGRRRIAIDPDDLFDRACRASLLVPEPTETMPDAYKFSHQLLQEQFAAQHLLVRWQRREPVADLWRTARTQAHMPAPEVGEWDPLPPPPPTGWEQTTILAAGILPQADKFVQAVLAANPALAGRCLAEGSAPVSDAGRQAVQAALRQDVGDPALHRRTRIQAGRVLAQPLVGDPRFRRQVLDGVNVILPDLVRVPGGAATLGSDDEEAFENEQPVHPVEVADFWLGKYPVTNAEYRCFMQAGGYDTERYWTPAGWQWRQGQAESSGAVESIMEIYRTLVNNPGLIDQLSAEGRVTKDWADNWRGLIQLSEEQIREIATNQFGQRRTDRPYYWDDPAYSGANQPVVGVTWYEAMAYCAWLNERIYESTNLRMETEQPDVWQGIQSKIQNLKSKIRLPTEAEWEWAAGGPDHHRYSWGDAFDEDKANTLEGRVLGTSPVGAYPGGVADCGALDLAGNVYDWTHSQYRPYPYRANDGREEIDFGTNVQVTLRGGSWYYNQGYARVSTRNNYHPVNFFNNIGFRVSVAPIFK